MPLIRSLILKIRRSHQREKRRRARLSPAQRAEEDEALQWEMNVW